MRKVFNFSAGPGMLPEEVLHSAQKELLNWHGTGMSVMEMGHRGEEFKEIITQTEKKLRKILNIPEAYHILFLSGGATAQFSMIPMNLLAENKTADYIDTGIWSQKAIKEATLLGNIHIAAKSKQDPRVQIPPQKEWSLRSDIAYVHYTPNETINGVEFHWIPDVGKTPLIADMSSTLLSRPIDVTQFGLIYAGAQKNIGPAGITLVIIRDDLIRDKKWIANTPTLYRYAVQIEHQSLYNTPPTYSWYMAGLVFDWIEQQGGLSVLAERNQRKAAKLYSAIDHSEMYTNPVDPSCRSWMNVPFSLKDEALNDTFMAEAKTTGLVNLSGHRSVGGMRASLYNAMPEAGVEALINFMQDFARRYG